MTASTLPVTTSAEHLAVDNNNPEQRNHSNATDNVHESMAPTTPLAADSPDHSEEAAASAPNADQNQSLEHDTPLDPKIVTLLGMFPGFDTSLLQSVLDSVSGDQDKAIDLLLGMSDPDFRSSERSDTTQTELDEEIARRLMLEESEQQQAPWAPRGQDVPYQARSHPTSNRYSTQSETQQRPAEGDSMAQFQEQLGRFAESGKKTFTTLFSKVKAKMQEFDSSPGQGQSPGPAQPLPHGDSWSTPAQSQSYYSPSPSRAYEGYEVGGGAPPNQALLSAASQPAGINQPVVPSTTSTFPPQSASPGVAATGSVDPSKIGLLPKRPVSLGSSPQPSKNFDEDEVEYVENPFEESTHR